MTSIVTMPGFARVSAALGSAHDPCEIHGLLCGMLCSRPGLTSGEWTAWLHGELEVPATDDGALEILFRASASRLEDAELGFELLLPDDECELSARARELGRWCQGFLSGLGLGGPLPEPLRGEADEFLHDAEKIARVGFDTDTVEEADEAAYAEIVEFVRVGVLLVHQELRGHRVRTARAGHLH